MSPLQGNSNSTQVARILYLIQHSSGHVFTTDTGRKKTLGRLVESNGFPGRIERFIGQWAGMEYSTASFKYDSICSDLIRHLGAKSFEYDSSR